MSSPGRLSDRARSSPSRRRANGLHRNSQHEAKSSQLIEELSQLLIDDDRSFKRKLDEESQAQQRKHVEALERALAQHDAVRRSAEHTFEAFQLEIERQKLAREAEERRKVEEQRRKLLQEQEAIQRRQEEQRRREEEERQRKEQLEQERKATAEREAARKKEEEAAQARDRAAQENAAREKEESDKRARAEHAAREAQQQQQQQQQQMQAQAESSTAAVRTGNPLDTSIGPPAVSTLSSTTPTALVTTYDDRMRVHQAYLKIHRRLKEVRQEVDGLKDSNDPAQRQLYSEIKTKKEKVNASLGQLLKGEEGREKNKQKIKLIKETWQWALKFFPDAVMDINEVRLEPVPTTMVTKGFIYIVSHSAKAMIRQMKQDAASEPAFADIIGVLIAQVFSGTTQLSGGYAMSDVLLAKFNKAHPVLFGKLGSEKTAAAREELGWDPGLSKQDAFNSFLGMSRCFAAITLRDFSRATTQVNPFPNRIYWETVARLLNTPSKDQMTLHYLTLRGLLEPEYMEKFIRLYGNMALAVLRIAIKDFPARRPTDNQTMNREAEGLLAYKDRYEFELNLRL